MRCLRRRARAPRSGTRDATVRAVDGVSLTVQAGETVGIVRRVRLR